VTKARWLQKIASAHAKVGRTKNAGEILAEAVDVAREIDSAEKRTRSLHGIAEAQAKAKLVEQAKGTFAEAVAAARSLGQEAPQGDAGTGRGVTAQLEAQFAGALAKGGAFADALSMARRIESKEQRARGLSAIAEAQKEANLPEQARQTRTEAISAARDIVDAEARAAVLCEIAVPLSNETSEEE
jgi:tetratricopeptide (TPR) repeat protein